MVNKFIENLHNAVWIRKEAEKVKAEQSQQDQIKDMYTKNLLNRKIGGEVEDIPQALLRINKREPVTNSSESKMGSRRRAFLPEQENSKNNPSHGSLDLVGGQHPRKSKDSSKKSLSKNRIKSKSPEGTLQKNEMLFSSRSKSPDARLRQTSTTKG